MEKQYLLAQIGSHAYGIPIQYLYRIFSTEEAKQVSEFEYEIKGGRAYNLNPLFHAQQGEFILLVWHEEHVGVLHAREVYSVQKMEGRKIYPIPRSWFRSHVDWIESVAFLDNGKPYYLLDIPSMFRWYFLHLYPVPEGAL